MRSPPQLRRFIEFPAHLYEGCSQRVPPLFSIQEAHLDIEHNLFYKQADADFFMAVRDGRDVGRIALFDWRLRNALRGTSQADFFFFDCEDDAEVAKALFDQGAEWAKARGLEELIGPKSPLSPFEGPGLLVEGFNHPQVMMMTPYNHPYYVPLLEENGFVKDSDYVTYQVNQDSFRLPPWVHEIADFVGQREGLRIRHFSSLEEVLSVYPKIITLYRKLLGDPITKERLQTEVETINKTAHLLVNPQLIKAVMNGETLAGFIAGFPDVPPFYNKRWGYQMKRALNKP